MGIRSTDSVLQQLYTVRDDLLSGKIQSYNIGDRNITLFQLGELERIIQSYESAELEATPVFADLSQSTDLNNQTPDNSPTWP